MLDTNVLIAILLFAIATCFTLIVLLYAKVLMSHSESVVSWHKREVENEDKHRERLEKRFDFVEAELKRLTEIMINRPFRDPK